MLKGLILNYLKDLENSSYKFINEEEVFEFVHCYFIENQLTINKNLKSKIKNVIIDEGFKIWNKNPIIFSLVDSDLNEFKTYLLKNNIIIKERSLHPTLEMFLTFLNHTSKTIYHESSKGKEYLKWLNPDIVSKKDNFYYSFEIKRHVSLNNFRPYLFQAISNSSWSNYGYLVCEKIDLDNPVLYKDLLELNGLYGIGLIKLDTISPTNSKILIESKYRDVNLKHLDKLIESNSEYKIL